MRRRKPILISLLGAGAAALLGVLAWPGAQAPAQAPQAATPPPPAVVEIALAEQRDSSGVAWVPGSVISRNDARLAGEVAGRLTFVAEVGSAVAAGDAVARVDDETLRLELRDTEAVIGRRQAQVSQAERHLERLRALKDNRLVAASQLDEAGSALEISRRDLVQAQVARDRARQRLGQATVRAPHAGVVVERLAQVGEYLQPGAAVARLVQTSDVELSARAPAALAQRLAPGDPVAVRQDGIEYQARIRAVVPAADQVSRQLELRLSLDDGQWLVGSAAEVALPQADAHSVVAVPRDALVLRPDGSYVFRIGADGNAERVAVGAGAVHDGWVEVTGAILAGDRLVVRGAERLRDGQAVAVRNADPAAPDARVLAAVNAAMTAG
jgi:RND family efflux transporter MFP subunit